MISLSRVGRFCGYHCRVIRFYNFSFYSRVGRFYGFPSTGLFDSMISQSRVGRFYG